MGIGVEREIEDMNVVAAKKGFFFQVVWDMRMKHIQTPPFFFKVDPFDDDFNLDLGPM